MTKPFNYILEPTHQHKKGGYYAELMRATREHDLKPMVVYQGRDGTVWVRPAEEFDDPERFRPLSYENQRRAG